MFAWPFTVMSAPVAVTSRGSPSVVRVSLFSFAMRSARRLTEQPVSAVAITLNFGCAAWESHKSMSGESPLFMVRCSTTNFAFSVSLFSSSASDASGFPFLTSCFVPFLCAFEAFAF